jgi:hypothetical protein
MMRKVVQIVKAFVFVLVLLTIVFMFLGLEMSSSYTRASPDCSVWCVIMERVLNIFS